MQPHKSTHGPLNYGDYLNVDLYEIIFGYLLIFLYLCPKDSEFHTPWLLLDRWVSNIIRQRTLLFFNELTLHKCLE